MTKQTTQPTRIAMVASQAPPAYGGAGTQALNLARRLVALSFEVDLLTQNQLLAARSDNIDGVSIRRAPGERIARLLPRRIAQIFRTATYTIWLSWLLARGRYRVFHVHGNYWFALVPAVLSRVLRVPVVLKVTRLGEDDAQTVRDKRIAGIRLGSIYSLPMRWASVVIALNDEIASRHADAFPDVRLLRVPNGVDDQAFAFSEHARVAMRKRLAVPVDAIVYLFVGYLAPHKGTAELLEAWKRIAPVNSDAWLVLVGPSSGFYRELSEDVAAAGLALNASRVLMLDQVEVSAMPAIYAAADVFVLPTQAEGMPNSLLEALASGLPSVVSSAPGVSEVVAGARSATTLPTVSADALSAALVHAVRGSDDRASKLPRRFRLDEVAEAYGNLYGSLIARNRKDAA